MNNDGILLTKRYAFIVADKMNEIKKLVCNKCGHEHFTNIESRYKTCEKCGKGRCYAVKECIVCKKQFKVRRRKQQVCGIKCRQKWSKIYLQKIRVRKCLKCGIEFNAKKERGGIKRIYCSKKCYKDDENSYIKIRHRKEVNFNSNRYWNIHKKIAKRLGMGEICWECGKKVKNHNGIVWANLDHKYSERTEDWVRLCKHCHYFYDKGEIKLTLKFKNYG